MKFHDVSLNSLKRAMKSYKCIKLIETTGAQLPENLA